MLSIGRPAREFRGPHCTDPTRRHDNDMRLFPASFPPLPRRSKTGLSWLFGALAGSLTLSLGSCFGDGIQSTLISASETNDAILDIYLLVTVISAAIFLIVFGILLWSILRYRVRHDDQDDTLPAQIHGNFKLELVWTIVPVLLLIVIAFPTWDFILSRRTPPEGDDVVKVSVTGKQWWWEFHYPEEDIVTGNEFHLPVGRPVLITATSSDVIHSFWLPRLAGKIDTIPGKENQLWFTPDEPGYFYGQCAEFCGTSHANMGIRVVVESEYEYRQWLEDQRKPPIPVDADAKAGEQLFSAKLCITCHHIQGVPTAQGRLGPDLTNLAARRQLAAGMLPNTPENLARWIHAPRAIKPGALMVLPLPVSLSEAEQLAAYLLSQPNEPVAKLIPAPGDSEEQTLEEQASGATDAAPAPPPQPVASTPADGPQLILTKGCIACHRIEAVPAARGSIGPALDGLSERPTIAAGLLTNTPENLRKWLQNPPAIKPDTNMIKVPLTDAELDTLVEYLRGL